ncbi:MAG: prephenate dehydrogenase [Lachnospiraceae bacterium]|nr:prephenate dehydrogenase [Lachnospiraceae bacterium]
MKILVIGLGLIGGSISKALKKYTAHEVGGFDIHPEIIDTALNEQAIDKIAGEDNFCDYDVLFICTNPLYIEDFLKTYAAFFKKGTIIADVGGVKGSLPDEMTEFCLKDGLFYVSAHPMAGKERPGYLNSDADLFKEANFIITPVSKSCESAMIAIEEIAKEIGFRNFNRISPDEHDRIIAYTSQLAHVISATYVKSPALEKEKGFTGGSFQDMTRIATMNEEMWSTLFSLNRDKLITEIDIFTKNLLKFRHTLAENNEKELKDLIYESRILKENDLKNTACLTRFD